MALDDSTDDAVDIDAKITYHQEMEHIATRAGDFTTAEHHRNMQDIYRKMKQEFIPNHNRHMDQQAKADNTSNEVSGAQEELH
jgi:hypothetical protein